MPRNNEPMSPLQIKFCKAVALGRSRDIETLLPYIDLVPTASKAGFHDYPAIFLLALTQHDDPSAIYKQLCDIYPNERGANVSYNLAPTAESMRALVMRLVYEPTRKDLHSFLCNIAQLEESEDTQRYQRYLGTCALALQLITQDPYFRDAPTQHLQLAHKLLQRFEPAVLIAKFEKMLIGMAAPTATRASTPDTVKTLLESLKNPSATPYSSAPTFLPSQSTFHLQPLPEKKADEEERPRQRCVPVLV